MTDQRQPADGITTQGFRRLVGYKTKVWTERYAEMTLAVDDRHDNSHGMVHGGIYATLLDAAFGHAVAYCGVPGRTRLAVTISLQTTYLKPAKSGTLTAAGRVIGIDGRVATCVGEIHLDDGTLCAIGHASFMYMPGSEQPDGVPPIPPQAIDMTTPTILPFGVLDGGEIREIVLQSADGRLAGSVLEIGATLRDLQVRLRDGHMQRVVCGLNSVGDYREHSPHMGAIAGRFANRIRSGRFVLDGAIYQLPLNENGRTALHGGGKTGFGKSAWTLLHADASSAVLALHSPAGQNGYPGAMTVTCRYSLRPAAALRIELSATTDAPTVVNLAHHSYFNLDGAADCLSHALMVGADLYAPVDADSVPDGTLAPVAGTHLDFRTPRLLGASPAAAPRIGIDTSFMLRRERTEVCGDSGLSLAFAASLSSAKSGLTMETWTTEPALQVYDGHKVSVPVEGLDGNRYGPCCGVALEPQHFPDSPNLPHFPSTTLRPGEVYRQITEYRF